MCTESYGTEKQAKDTAKEKELYISLGENEGYAELLTYSQYLKKYNVKYMPRGIFTSRYNNKTNAKVARKDI